MYNMVNINKCESFNIHKLYIIDLLIVLCDVLLTLESHYVVSTVIKMVKLVLCYRKLVWHHWP